MKFSCEKEILLGLLGTASRAVTGKKLDAAARGSAYLR